MGCNHNNKFDEWFDCLSDTDKPNAIAGMLLLREKRTFFI